MMRLVGLLSTVLLISAPVAASAQGHGGMAAGAGRAGVSQVSMTQGASWGPGFGPSHGGLRRAGGSHGRGFDNHHGFHDHDHLHGAFLGWGPYWGWGWQGCGAFGDACDWGEESGPGAPSDDYGYTDGPTSDAACGAWLRRGAGYVWTRRVCGEPAAADPPAHAVATNECSDWVWRADLHRSVCKRGARAEG
ncbi:MAG TPA: hypothetical protein VHS81_03705 [Caulobacteraceae bacterium]|nr:hypothetical protein [Caulobacteraceae bacterium]